jgi:hypothetical protein
MRALAIPLAFLLGFSAPVCAADLGPAPMPTKAPPVVEPVVDYTPLLLVGVIGGTLIGLCLGHVICPQGHPTPPPVSPSG